MTHNNIILTEPENEDVLQPAIDKSQDPLTFAANLPD